jgi:hypothetical protein
MSSRPQSSRSRPPSGRSNVTTARSNSRPQTPSTITNLNEPLIVNRKYCGNHDPITPRNVTPMLPKSRFPTVYAGPETPPKRKVLTCPEGWIEEQLRVKPPIRDSMENRTKIAQEFIDHNLDRMQEYRFEYTNKSPRTLQEMLVNTKGFGSLMNELQHKERARKIGTSSHQINSSLDERGAKSVRDVSWDPNITTLSTSRSKREIQVNRLFAPTVALHATEKKFNRGYCHAPEYGNFSSYQGCLVKNQGAMLSR